MSFTEETSNKIADQELSIVKWWNAKGKSQVKRVIDPYSTFDLEGNNVIVEVKHRHKAYDTKLIETMKLSSNFHYSQVKNKTFIYIVCDSKGLSVFNITKNIEKIIKLPEHIKTMEYKHYVKKTPIKKLHRNLPKELSEVWEQEF